MPRDRPRRVPRRPVRKREQHVQYPPKLVCSSRPASSVAPSPVASCVPTVESYGTSCSRFPHGATKNSTRAVYAAFDDRDGDGRVRDAERGTSTARLPRLARPRILPGSLRTTLRARRSRPSCESSEFWCGRDRCGARWFTGCSASGRVHRMHRACSPARAAAWLARPLLIFSAHGESDRRRARREPFRAAPSNDTVQGRCSRSPRSRASSSWPLRFPGGWSSCSPSVPSRGLSRLGGGARDPRRPRRDLDGSRSRRLLVVLVPVLAAEFSRSPCWSHRPRSPGARRAPARASLTARPSQGRRLRSPVDCPSLRWGVAKR